MDRTSSDRMDFFKKSISRMRKRVVLLTDAHNNPSQKDYSSCVEYIGPEEIARLEGEMARYFTRATTGIRKNEDEDW